jgi:hypothetical protein
MHIGPVNLFLAPTLSAEWNDNVNLSPDQPEPDFILRPQVNVGAFWPASEYVRLNLAAGVGYAWYVEGHHENRLLITPDSNLAVDLPVKDVVVTFYDQATYQDDLAANAALDATRDNANVQNTAGLRATWMPGDWVLQAGYAHFNYFSLTKGYEYLNRASEQFFGRAGYALAGETRAGLEASGSMSAYDQSWRSDFYSVSFGPFLEWSITEAVQVTARGGYVEYISEPNAYAPPPGNVNSYYFGIEASHQITEHLSQRLGGIRDVQVGTTSAYLEQLTVHYDLRWAFTDFAQLSAGVTYEHGQEPRNQFVEEYDRLGFSIGLSYQLTQRLSSTLAYRYARRDSNLPGQEYQQNSVTLSAAYRF